MGNSQSTDSGSGNGADDEDPRGGVEGDGGEAEMVGGGRDHRGDRPDHAALAGAVPGARLQWAVGPPQAEPQPEADPGSGAGGAAQEAWFASQASGASKLDGDDVTH